MQKVKWLGFGLKIPPDKLYIIESENFYSFLDNFIIFCLFDNNCIYEPKSNNINKNFGY